MSEIDQQCLATFPEWLRSLANDATDLAETLNDANAPDAARRYAAGGLNYLFKSLDLITDGIEDLGYLDDAFVMRVAAALAVKEAPDTEEKAPKVARLAKDTKLLQALLESDYARLETYVERLKSGAARGRSVDEILQDEDVRRDFLCALPGHPWQGSFRDAPFFAMVTLPLGALVEVAGGIVRHGQFTS